jgi:oligopeptide/dipeptide ABC transporter ATP-binding protein
VRGAQLSKFFALRRRGGQRLELIRAVQDASLGVSAGETLGLVGESGSGKTTLGRLLLRLVEPTYGRVIFDGTDITHQNERDLRSLRRRMQIIFQDAPASLNGQLPVSSIVAEPLRIHGIARHPSAERERVAGLLESVGLSPDVMGRYPPQLSSGECQRVGIARALALDPDFIVCDDPLDALDPSEQAQIADLLASLQETRRHAYLFISHDVRMVMHLSHQVAVMYAGRIVEAGPALALARTSAHPYTRALLSAVPVIRAGRRRLRVVLEGDPPSPLHPVDGCAFQPRCPHALPGLCEREPPPLAPLAAGSSHEVACWHARG